MRFILGVAAASVFSATLLAQDPDHPEGGTVTVAQPETVADMQAQARFQFENLVGDMQNASNQQKQGLLAQRAGLNQKLADCSRQKSRAELEAEQNAANTKQGATQGLANGAMQGVAPLIQNGLGYTAMSTAEAKRQKDDAILAQHRSVVNFTSKCQSAGNFNVSSDGKNINSIISALDTEFDTYASAATATGTVNQSAVVCRDAAHRARMQARDAKEQIRQADEVAAKSAQNKAAMILTAGALGLQYWNYTNANKSADQMLKDSSNINAMDYQACVEAVMGEVKEIDRQIAAIDAQLQNDINRAARQLANQKFKVTPNTLGRTDLFSPDGNDLKNIGTLANAGVGSNVGNLGGKDVNLKDLLNKDANKGGGAGAGGGGGGGAAAGGDAKPTWGFSDPSQASNPGLGQRLPDQPEKAGLVGGNDGGGLAGSNASNPFGEGFMGFEDPFANVGAQAALAGKGGNGFFELALKTKRRVIAHLQELLSKPIAPDLAKDDKKNIDRKITSTRN